MRSTNQRFKLGHSLEYTTLSSTTTGLSILLVKRNPLGYFFSRWRFSKLAFINFLCARIFFNPYKREICPFFAFAWSTDSHPTGQINHWGLRDSRRINIISIYQPLGGWIFTKQLQLDFNTLHRFRENLSRVRGFSCSVGIIRGTGFSNYNVCSYRHY